MSAVCVRIRDSRRESGEESEEVHRVKSDAELKAMARRTFDCLTWEVAVENSVSARFTPSPNF